MVSSWTFPAATSRVLRVSMSPIDVRDRLDDRFRLLSRAPTEGILFHNNGIAIEVNEAFASVVLRFMRDWLLFISEMSAIWAMR